MLTKEIHGLKVTILCQSVKLPVQAQCHHFYRVLTDGMQTAALKQQQQQLLWDVEPT